VIEAAIFDLDGLLIDSEEVWDAVREVYVGEHGLAYSAEVQRAMMGMSSGEWSRYLHESVGIPDEPAAINDEVVRRMQVAYAKHLPLVPGAVDAVERVAARFPLALASSSNRPLIDEVLELSGLAPLFRATVSSEEVWDAVRETFVRERGGRYDAEVQRAMMGMSSGEWARYLHESAGVSDEPDAINAEVVERMLAAYREHLPLVPGAVEAVERLAARWPLGLASSSNRPLIDAVLELAGLASFFRATVSSEEVDRGKPAPDVYLETARRLGVAPDRCAAIEDSHAGIRSAHAAGMRVVAIPNPSYPPDAAALAQADIVLRSLTELTPGIVAA